MPRGKRVHRDLIRVNEDWNIQVGELRPFGRGPHSTNHLFKYVAEKLPWAALPLVSAYLKSRKVKRVGVYMAHDSFGVARYGGRGNIFNRLRTHKQKYSKELVYFSFYIIENKTHEREIENVILRAAGPQMLLNQLKVRDGIEPGGVGDYEPGTKYFRRRYAGGAKRDTRLRRTRR
jgi:hypothetical protein